jgi:hypothetical protein
VVYLYLLPHPWFTPYYLHGHGVLDEYEALYNGSEKEPITLPVRSKFKSKKLIIVQWFNCLIAVESLYSGPFFT